MADHLSAALPFALGLALSPIPVIAMLLVLSTPRGRANGPALFAGWLVASLALGAVVVALGESGGDGDASPAVRIVSGVVGLALLALAAKQWSKRPRGDGPVEAPGWVKRLDAIGPLQALGLGVAFSIGNPKNLVLTIAGAAAIVGEGGSTGTQLVATAVFVLVGTLGLLVPLALYLGLGERAERILAQLHRLAERHGPAVLAVVLALIGLKLVIDAIAG